MLKVCATAREARHILNDRGVLVDGRPITDPKFPVGLMDVLSFAVTKAHYRMLVNTRGKMALVPIEEADANWKLCRVEDKTTVRRGKTQLNLHDGRNVLLEKDAYKTGATLKVHVPDQKVVEQYELGKGAPVLVTGGQHVGEIAHVLEVQRTRNPRANTLSQFQTSTAPRRVSRFFRVWMPSGLPRLANHSVYFGSATVYFRATSRPAWFPRGTSALGSPRFPAGTGSWLSHPYPQVLRVALRL